MRDRITREAKLWSGRRTKEWRTWLENEVREDEKEHMVYHPIHGRDIYAHLVNAFLDALDAIDRLRSKK